jgi:hypothetical protein
VEKINPALVVREENGSLNTVRYDQVNAMLLNEFLKAHTKMEKQQFLIAPQQKLIERLVARLDSRPLRFGESARKLRSAQTWFPNELESGLRLNNRDRVQ